MDWTDIRDNIESTSLDFKNSATKRIGLGKSSDNIDEALEILTSNDYSPIYGAFQGVTNELVIAYDEDNISNVTTLSSQNADEYIPSMANIRDTKTIQYGAWDPRLSRVDAFLAVKGSEGEGTSPTIIPFSSESAAGAFFDLVFHTEAVVDKALDAEYKNKNNVEISYSKDINFDKSSEDQNNNNNKVMPSEQVFRGEKDKLDYIRTKGDAYGLGSVVNPYTLTKLCGSIKVSGTTKSDNANDLSKEPRLYDVRDIRRFYDMSIQSDDDFLSITNPTTTNIITYSNKDPWGRTPYYFQDFVFCKYWNVIPNNRLITFRKYQAPVYDNLQFPGMMNKNGTAPKKQPFAPIATVITYFGDETGNTLQNLTAFTTGTKWKDVVGDIHTVSGDSGSDPHATIDNMFTNGGGFSGATSELGKALFNNANLLTGKILSFGKFAGLLSPDGYNINKDQQVFDMLTQKNVDPYDQLYHNKILGPVNRVTTTRARDAGIVFDHKISLTCEYVSRPIGGINTKAAMLDILSNCMEIASVEAVFWGGGYRFNVQPHMYPFKGSGLTNTIMDDLYAGRIFGKDGALAHTIEGVKSFGTNDKGEFDWGVVAEKMKDFMGSVIGGIGELLNSVSNVIFGESSSLSQWIGNATNTAGTEVSGEQEKVNRGRLWMKSLGSNLNSMWRAQVIKNSVIPSVNGMRAILTGEPVGNWHLTVGNPLNPIMVIGNLICTDMKFEFSEEMGPDDFPLELKVVYSIEHAMARDKAAIQSMFNRGAGKIYQLPDYIRASSDYESKVDAYTGPGTSGPKGWVAPGHMFARGGSGFQTYKISPGKTLPMNAHTDNIFIAKFTPVDIDAAISNIKQETTFFGAMQGSRAYIRGTAMTRKLMN